MFAYGHVGGNHDATAAINTSRIVDAILEENKAQGRPAIISMDLNANPEDINSVATKLLGSERWIDVGARASLWGGTDIASTCNTIGPNTGTRSYYIFVHPTPTGYIHQVRNHDDKTYATHARVEITFRLNGNQFPTRIAGKITPLHDMNPNEDDGINWEKSDAIAIEGELQKEEHNLAALQYEGNMEGMYTAWVRVMEEGIILSACLENQGPAVPRGRGSPTTRWALQQPVLRQITLNTITCGKEEAEKQQAIRDIGEDANRTQAAYRQLQCIQKAIAKAKPNSYNDIPQHIKSRIDKTYREHAMTVNTNTKDAADAGLITMNAFQIKLKHELTEMLQQSEGTKTKLRRATRAATTKAFSYKTQGMRRAYAASRPPPQQPLTVIQHEGKTRFTPDDIDHVYDLQLGKMFEGEHGGHRRRLARAGAFIEKYEDLCHHAPQSKINPLEQEDAFIKHYDQVAQRQHPSTTCIPRKSNSRLSPTRSGWQHSTNW